MVKINFEVKSRTKRKTFTIIRMRTAGSTLKFTVFLENETGNVLYPLEIESVVPGIISITLISDTAASCSFPPSIPETMVNKVAEQLNMFHDIVIAAREQIAKEQKHLKDELIWKNEDSK